MPTDPDDDVPVPEPVPPVGDPMHPPAQPPSVPPGEDDDGGDGIAPPVRLPGRPGTLPERVACEGEEPQAGRWPVSPGPRQSR